MFSTGNNTKLVDKGYLFNLTVKLWRFLSPHSLAVISLLIVFRYFMEEQYLVGYLVGIQSSHWMPGEIMLLGMLYHQCCPHPIHLYQSVGEKTFQVNWNNVTGNIVQFMAVWTIIPPQPLPLVSPGSLLRNTKGILAIPCTSMIFPGGKTVSPFWGLSSNGPSETKWRCLSFKHKYTHQL